MGSPDRPPFPSPGVDSFTNPPLFSSSFIRPPQRMPEQKTNDRKASVGDAVNDNNSDSENEDDDLLRKVNADFGGPEDFTEHLSEYMFGLRDFKPKSENAEDHREDKIDHDSQAQDQDETQQSFTSKQSDVPSEQSLSEPLASSTPSPKEITHLHFEQGEESPQLPSPTLAIPKTRPASPAADDIETPRRIVELRKEIERMREGEEERKRQLAAIERENEELRRENEEAYRRFEEIDRLSQPDQTKEIDVETEASAHEKIKILQHELSSAREKATKLESDHRSYTDSASGVVAQLNESLQKQKEEAESERNKSFIVAREAAKLNELKEQQEATISHLRSEMESLKSEFAKTRDDLRETKRVLQDVEDENDKLDEENAEQKALLQTHNEGKDTAATELRAAHLAVADLRSKLRDQEDNDEAQRARDALVVQHERAITTLKNKHVKDISTLKTALQTASSNRKKSELEMKRHHLVEIDALKARVADLELPEGASSSHSAEEELRSAIRVMNAKLSKGNAIIKSLRSELAAAREKGEGMWKDRYEELEEKHERREDEWNRRIDMLFQERDKMAKVLMHQWGEMECGKGGIQKEGGQVYRYKYAGEAAVPATAGVKGKVKGKVRVMG